MKYSFWTIIGCALILSMLASCHFDHHEHNTNISISELNGYYKMSAFFNKNRTKQIHEYMDAKLGRMNHISFVNAEIYATLTLDDRTKFYIKTSPGDLQIKLDKSENSVAAYIRVKKMCEGIKAIIEGK